MPSSIPSFPKVLTYDKHHSLSSSFCPQIQPVKIQIVRETTVLANIIISIFVADVEKAKAVIS